MWQTPVYDRTAADVAAGAEKCYITAELLNRIEGNTAISRVHLLVRYTGQCFAVEDKNSTNGTCINGNRLEPGELVKLKNGDKLKMGNEVFTVEIR